MDPLIPGFSVLILSALIGGAYAVPLRLRRRYAMENTMLVAFAFATLIIPFIAVTFILPEWPQAVSAVGISTVLLVAVFGFCWGMGAVTFALGVSSIGLSITYAVVMGINTGVGSIIPMITRWETIPAGAKAIILAGIAVCIAGVAVCGKAGILRESGSGSKEESSAAQKSYRIFIAGLLWCVVSGVLSAGANLGFHFGEPLGKEAARMGANPSLSTVPQWLPMWWGGYLANLVFLGSTMLRGRSWTNFAGPGAGRDFGLAVAMGTMHFLGQTTYGIGAHYLGNVGTSVGWAVSIALSLIVANLFGFITGEWRKAPRVSINTLYRGLAVLVISIVILAVGNSVATG